MLLQLINLFIPYVCPDDSFGKVAAVKYFLRKYII